MAMRVLVTGGASGIGAAVVESFMNRGARVVCLDTRESSRASVSVIGDVTNPADQQRAVTEATSDEGGLDVLVANAGIHDGGAGFDLNGDDLVDVTRRVLDVDVLGYVLTLHAAAPALRQARGCAILTLSDATFLAGQTGAGVAYTAAKYAGLGILRWAARSLAPDVRVNAVAPGGVLTDLQAPTSDGGHRGLFDNAEKKAELIRSRNILGTLMTPEDIAELYGFLASPAARGMTGEVIRPDGGLGLA